MPNLPQNPRMTCRRTKVLEFIANFFAQAGYAPSIRQIGLGVGLSSSSTVWTHLRALETLGKLTRDPRSPRSIRLAGAHPTQTRADLERRLALADAVIQAAVDSPYSLDCATFAAIQAYRAAAPVAGEVAA